MTVSDLKWSRFASSQNVANSRAATRDVQAHYFDTLDDGRIRCLLCPHYCRLTADQEGICGVRVHRDGALALPFYGAASARAVDPIEKKPLFHYFPGQSIYSVGFLGCPLRCPFCQNYRISQSTTATTERITPAELVRAAAETSSIGIAYTYNEPVIHFEFIMETADLARRAGLKNVLVTSGQVNPAPARELFDCMDATNIDLKSFDPGFYRRELAGNLPAVKRSIEIAGRRCHVEVTTLVIPGKTDADHQIDAMARFLASLNEEMPYHLSAYYPAYQYVTRPTEPATILRLADVARRHLRYVYSGNIVSENHTLCRRCAAILVARTRSHTRLVGLRDGACAACGCPSPIVNS